jgi:DNA-binding CsgD family transcriptional regulator
MKRGRVIEAKKSDEVSVVEAAYKLDGSEEEWLSGIAQMAVSLLDQGWGITASTWRVTAQELGLRAIVPLGGPNGFSEAVVKAMRETSPDIQRLPVAASAPCTSLSALGGAERVEDDPGSQALIQLGIRDCLMILGLDSSGYGTLVSAYMPTAGRPSRQTVSRWSRLASHLSSGFRVRRGLDALFPSPTRRDPLVGSEAILTPRGSLEHAERPAAAARRVLAEAALAVDRARGKLRQRDPDAALEAWKGLVAGRWSLVDHIDTDGKRFLVARRNDPAVDGPGGLTLRERQVMASRSRGLSLKLIAYDLGLSIGAVSKTLGTGMAKLGIVADAELPPLFGFSPPPA